MAKNPRKVVEAFSAAGAEVAGIQLREFTIGTILILEKIGSPLLKAAGGKPEPMTDLDLLRVLFIQSHPASESFRLLRSGTDAFDEAVVEFGDKIPLAKHRLLKAKFEELLSRSVSTSPSPGAEKKSGERAETPSTTSRPPVAGSAGS